MKKSFTKMLGCAALAISSIVALNACSDENSVDSKDSVNIENGEAGSEAKPLVDKRDGKSYKTTKIGDQVWMAENLNYKVDKSTCYKNNPSECEKLGRLYEWEAAQDACPGGWHLPSKEEFEILLKKVSKSTELCALCSKNWSFGTNPYGFSALPAGYLKAGNFVYEAERTRFWTSTESTDDLYHHYNYDIDKIISAYHFTINLNYESSAQFSDEKSVSLSVRCLKD